MNARNRIVTAPTLEPISLVEAKDHLRVTHNDEDAKIIGLIRSARQYVEEVCGRAIMSQTRAHAIKDWPAGDVITLPFPPVQSVTSVIYTDTDDVSTTWSTDYYTADVYSEPARIVLAYGETWPSASLHWPDYPIEVIYVCGYTSAGLIPEPIKDAIRLKLELIYDRPPEAYFKTVESAIFSLIDNYRVFA